MLPSENIAQFAERVEELCGHLLDKVEKDGSDDVVVLQQLKDEAADIVAGKMFPDLHPLEGLAGVLR